MRNLFKNFRKSEDGAHLVEYGVALIIAIIVGGTVLVNLAGDTKQPWRLRQKLVAPPNDEPPSSHKYRKR